MFMIRKASENDVQSIYDLICELEEKTFNFGDFKAIFLNMLEDEKHVFLLYVDNDIVKGLCHFTIDYHLHHCDKVADILEFVIGNQYRNQGIGHEFIQKAIEIAKEEHCEQIELDTHQRRKQAHKFYEREGLINDHYNFIRKL